MNDGSERNPDVRCWNPRLAVSWVVAGVIVTLGCGDPPRSDPPAVPVTVAQVEQRSVPFEVTAPGTV